MTTPITASMLYNLVQCPKRLNLDLYGDQSLRNEINPFVQILWERGSCLIQLSLLGELARGLDLRP